MEERTLKAAARFDRVGMSASLACAVHCAVLPLLLAAIPTIGLAWLDSAWVDWSMVLLALGIASRAHFTGYQLHRRCLPAGAALIGVVILVTTLCFLKGSASHHYIQASGAVIIAGSHFLNHGFCRSCSACHSGYTETECQRQL